ncbi:hypothetical protein GCK32_004519 [Trichostrongylus colubriformis]|uniref:J domain-containing protein n=1 Tax=Trichostrongylus colubriformis TaxID=6319 RepID=A0AAN8J1Q5_TRICO
MLTLTRSRGASVFLKRGVSYLPRRPNYYEILGVEQNATREEIRSAFVKKSHELHPDRRAPSQDRRKGWRRSSDTESFMELKEAYDCLRKPANRATYDSGLINAAGYLREASHLKYKQSTIIGLNRNRNEVYNGLRGPSSPVSSHFRDLEQEYYKEKHRNRMFVVMALLAFMLVLANIGYVRKDYYQVLGVDRDATQRQIKQAYYQLSKKYHPDVAGRSAGTESKFIEITEAYECLKDPERRRIYDGSTTGRGGRFTDGSSDYTDYRQSFGQRQRRQNPFYSKHYTQQEYERIWEHFKKMQAEREAYDSQFRREGERIWEQFARERATRWQQFHSRYPNGAPGSTRFEWKWNSSDPTASRNIVLFTRLVTIYMICFVVVALFQAIAQPLPRKKKASYETGEDRKMASSNEPVRSTTFNYMMQPPSGLSDDWNVISSGSSNSDASDSALTSSSSPYSSQDGALIKLD